MMIMLLLLMSMSCFAVAEEKEKWLSPDKQAAEIDLLLCS